MKKYYQLLLVIVCLVSVVTLLIYRHEYYRLRYVLEVLNFFGRPGVTNQVELCSPSINASIITGRINSLHANSLDIPPYFQRIDDNHYAYSSFWRKNNPYSGLTVQSQYYGVSNTIVLGSKHAKQNFRCHFLFEEDEKPIFGKFSYSRLESKASIKESKDHVLFVFHCKLTRSLGTPWGITFYPNSESNPFFSPVIKLVDLDKDSDTDGAEKNVDGVTFENNSKITICVMPNKLPTLNRKNIVEFLSFHKLMGITEYHVYDNSLPSNILDRIQVLPIEVTGFTIYTLPFNYPLSSEDSYHLMRDLAELDCAFRNLNRNKKLEMKDVRSHEKTSHIINLAWDEFIVPRYHHSLKVLVNRYEAGKKTVKLQLPTLNFCINQRNDPKVKPDYPDIVKKTHYDKSTTSERPIYIYNIGSLGVNDIAISTTFELHDKNSVQRTEKLSQDIIAIQKYTDCRENGYNRPVKDVDMDFADFETRPHQFEGAMLRFAEDLYNCKLYTLYRKKLIWPPGKSNVVDQN